MFEKEAEEIEKEAIKWVKDVFPNDEFKQSGISRALVEFAEFGYNKANEWHYVKDELPPKKVPLNIITFDKNKKRRVWVGEYDGGNGQWWTGYFNHFIDMPYAWKEIVLPKEIEENE